MSKASEQMDIMTKDDIQANPCGFCYACNWEGQVDCYDGNPAQCSICRLLLRVIDKCEESQNDTAQ